MTVLDRFMNKSNGRVVVLALKAKFVGKVVWEKIVKYSWNFLENYK